MGWAQTAGWTSGFPGRPPCSQVAPSSAASEAPPAVSRGHKRLPRPGGWAPRRQVLSLTAAGGVSIIVTYDSFGWFPLI